MISDRIVDLMLQLGRCAAEMYCAYMEGRHRDVWNFIPTLGELSRRFAEANASACVFRKNRYPETENSTTSTIIPAIRNWPKKKRLIHAHITCVFRFTCVGHIEVRIEEIEIKFIRYSEGTASASEKDFGAPPKETKPVHKDRMLSEEEMKRFLQSMGLEGLNEKQTP